MDAWLTVNAKEVLYVCTNADACEVNVKRFDQKDWRGIPCAGRIAQIGMDGSFFVDEAGYHEVEPSGMQIPDARLAARDGEDVYAIDAAGELFHFRRDTGQKRKLLAAGGAEHIAVTPRQVVWSDRTGRLRGLNRQTGGPSNLASGVVERLIGDAAGIVWATHEGVFACP
jgi:hypothetical protein